MNEQKNETARESGAARNNYPSITQHQLDAIAEHMDDEIREALHSAREWQHPGEFLTACLERHPGFPIGQFGTTAESPRIRQIEDEQTARLPRPRHSGIGYVTPAQRHSGEDAEILEARQAPYESKRAERPERWSGATRNWNHTNLVTLNPEREGLCHVANEAADMRQIG